MISDELLGLIADINPAEIASHIAQGNLHEWCSNWKSAAEQVVVKMNNAEIITTIARPAVPT